MNKELIKTADKLLGIAEKLIKLAEEERELSSLISEIADKVGLKGRARIFFENFAFSSYTANCEFDKTRYDDMNLSYDLSIYRYKPSDVQKIYRAWNLFKEKIRSFCGGRYEES